MNARIHNTLNDTRDTPIARPLEPLPAIFSSVRRSGFSTARNVATSNEARKENVRAFRARSN